MAEINEALRRHVSRVSFSLQLAKTHIWALWAIKNDLWCVRRQEQHFDFFDLRSDAFLSAYRGLEKRGLAYHKEFRRDETGAIICQGEYDLTPAGERVYDLCQMAGLMPETAANNEAAEQSKTA